MNLVMAFGAESIPFSNWMPLFCFLDCLGAAGADNWGVDMGVFHDTCVTVIEMQCLVIIRKRWIELGLTLATETIQIGLDFWLGVGAGGGELDLSLLANAILFHDAAAAEVFLGEEVHEGFLHSDEIGTFGALLELVLKPSASTVAGTLFHGASGADCEGGVAAVVGGVMDHDLLPAVEAFLHRVYLLQQRVAVYRIITILQSMGFLQYILHFYISEAMCLSNQTFLTIIAIYNIRKNAHNFPLKQLGPNATISAILCFLFSNILLLIGRIYTSAAPTSCHLASPFILTLAILYNILRELPFVLFALKTLRVSLCFWPIFNRMYVEKINKKVIGFFRSEAYIIFFSVVYVVAYNTAIVIVYLHTNSEYNPFVYQYFCQPSPHINPIHIFVYVVRLLSLGGVLLLSLWTYDELDFKYFFTYIFFASNLTLIPKLLALLFNSQEYDLEVYYTTFIVELINTVIMTYYSDFNQELNQPAMQGVLQSWEAFHNLKLGMVILEEYALYCDENANDEVKYNFRCLESFQFLDTLIKLSKVEDTFELSDYMEVVEKILERNDLVQAKLGGSSVVMLKGKCREGMLEMKDVKKIEKVLSDYCEHVLLVGWKETISYQFLKKEFINNGDINEKLQLFRIPIS